MMFIPPVAIQGAGRLLAKALTGAALAASVVSCIREHRIDCPVPFDFSVGTSAGTDGGHVFDIDISPYEDGLVLSLVGKVDGNEDEAIRKDGIRPEKDNRITVSLPRLEKGRHSVSLRVMDADFGLTKETSLVVEGIKAETAFHTEKDGSMVVDISFLEGPSVEFDASYQVDGKTVDGANGKVSVEDGGSTRAVLPHQTPGTHVFKAVYKAGHDEQALEFPFVVDEGVLDVTVEPEEGKAAVDLLLSEGDFNTSWGLEFLLDGRPVVPESSDPAASPDVKTMQVFSPGTAERFHIPVGDYDGHQLIVVLSDGEWSRRFEKTVKLVHLDVSLSMQRNGRDTWIGTVHLEDGEPDGLYSLQVFLDGKPAAEDIINVPQKVSFDVNGNFIFNAGPLPVGRHTVKVALTLYSLTAEASAALSEDRLGISLSFSQKTFGCYHGTAEGGWNTERDFNCVIHEDMAMTVDYGWKGPYDIEVYMKEASTDEAEHKVTRRVDEVTESGVPGAAYVPFDKVADLSSGSCVVPLPQGRPKVLGRDDDGNRVRVVVTPRFQGASPVEFEGFFLADAGRVNGLYIGTGCSEETEVGGPWSYNEHNLDKGFAYAYAVNGVTFSDILSGYLVPAKGVFGLTRYYKDNPPVLTVDDPSVCDVETGSRWNLVNVVGLKPGRTRLTIKKDLAVAVIDVTVTATRAGDGFDVVLDLPHGSGYRSGKRNQQ
ncbi:MAG: hypothetical protein IKN06_01825 [Bacteroidales bacterium]|nr:hypothetical protein [Bacteroidales bacterium]